MCELCEKYGDGNPWYLNPMNYARPLYRKLDKDKEKEPMILEELRGPINIIKPLIDLMDNPEAFKKAKEQFSKHQERMVGQVVSLEDAKKMVEIAQPIAKIDCICRRTFRATLEDGLQRSRSCLGLGIGMFRWEEWPERYKGGVEFLSSGEAKKHLEHWHKRGMVITIMAFGTPYIGGICLCDYPDCIAIRMRLDYNVIPFLLKGHQVAKIDYEECIGCGSCAQRCQFGAIKMEVTTNKSNIDLTRCFGCGVCVYACPQDAIRLIDRKGFSTLKEEW
jgi:ferredoxin